MPTVITTRDIPTLGGVIRAGVLLSVVSWGEDGAANLAGLNGWPRVSMAAAESFEVADAGHQPPHQQETSHDQSRSVRVTPTHDTAGDRGRDPQAVGSSGGDVNRDVREACPFEPSEVSGLHREVSRDGESASRPTVGDINAELAASGGERSELTRELREQVRFARPVSGGRNGWPVMRSGNKTPEQLAITVDPEAVGMPSFPRSSWHPHRSHWPEPWRLAEYGITAMGRTFWTADHPDHRYEGKEWVCHVDLNTGEFKAPFEPWQRIEVTTEARRHGDESCLNTTKKKTTSTLPVSMTMTNASSNAPCVTETDGISSVEQLAATATEQGGSSSNSTTGVGGRLLWNADHPDHRYEDKEWVCHVDLNTGEFKAPFHPWQKIDSTTEARRHGDEVGIPCSTELEGTGANIASVDCVESRNPEVIDISTRQDKASGVEMSCPDLPSSGHQSSVISQWPAPHDGMTLDERRGHRRVRNERGDIVWRCGPGPGETLAEFTAWRQRLDAFFEQKTSKETKGAA